MTKACDPADTEGSPRNSPHKSRVNAALPGLTDTKFASARRKPREDPAA
jgi:hypothetical protein